MSSQPLQSADNTRDLTEAFLAFNDLSERLTSAYAQLETQVSTLNEELVQSRNERHSERMQKEQLADRLGAVLEALPAGVVLVDGRDRIDRFNPAAECLFSGLAWGRLWSEVRSEELLADTGAGDWLLSDERRVNVTCQPLGDSGQILVMVDVTQQRELEERIQRQDRLSDMGEMAAQLAHQVRTPLASALLYASQLRKPGLDDERRIAFAGQLVDGLKHTEKLVSDMLAFSRGGQFSATSLLLMDVVEQSVMTLHPRIQASHAQIDLDVEQCSKGRVLGNRDALVGAICNLLENSLNHCAEAPQLSLSLACDERMAVLHIRDNGPGVPADVRERIFDPFFTTRERGTGLGLAVVQSVLLAHDGSIRLCESDRGACFELRLPLQKTLSESAPDAAGTYQEKGEIQ